MYIMAVRKQPIIFNPTWAGAMEYIKENTPENSVIDCWWPPGHFITGMGRRGVLFDGATLEKHVGYWVSRFFLSSDEKKALGILRMIDLAGNSATEYLVSKGIPLSEAVSILNTITAIDRGSAASYLESRLKLPEVNELLSMTHGQPPPSYVMVYRDLAEKSIAFQFLGNWDFKKAEEFKAIKENTPDLAAQIIKDKADNNMIKFYWMISGGPMYQENESPQAHRAGNVVQFANGIALDLDTMSISPMTGDTRVADKISSVVYAEGNSIKERYQASGGGLALLLVRRGEAYSVVIVDRRLKDCMLFRLYYFNGIGLEHFKEVFSLNADSENTDIKLFRVDW
jgi:dolichyl-diphosphooligosaccharide--protein glycosyltransferase